MRELCPNCDSSTALGEIKCFKCGWINARLASPMNYHIPDVRQMVNNLEVPEGLIFSPHNFHPEALAWLAEAYIFNGTIVRQGLAYSPTDHKVFVPAYDEEDILHFYQMRSLRSGGCKYLTYGRTSDYLIHYKD